MQITINESEIKLAIRNHILSQISVRDDQQIDVDLRATRGAEGYTAVIDIAPHDPTKPSKRTTESGSAAGGNISKIENKGSGSTKASAESEPEPEEAPQDTRQSPEKDTPDAEPAVEAEAVVEAVAAEEPTPTRVLPFNKAKAEEEEQPVEAVAERRSLFAGLTKPVNRIAVR